MSKPTVVLKGLDANISPVADACREVLGNAKSKELSRRVNEAEDFSHALAICGEYVNFE